MNDDTALQRVLDILATRRAAAREAFERYERDIRKEFPKFIELEDNLKTTTSSALEEIVSHRLKQDEACKLIKAAEKKLNDYAAANGIEPNKSFATCKLCSDTGYVNGERCKCFDRLLRDCRAEDINAHSPLELCSFDGFDLSFYSKEKDPKHKISPFSAMKRNLELCRKYAQTVPETPQNLLMLGGVGLGKTHLALSIANALLARGCDVVYCSAASIFRKIDAEYYDGRNTATMDDLKECSVLILDDLGTEYMTSSVANSLYDLVNTRVNRRASTVYTTNIEDEELLAARYGDAVASRLKGCCDILPFIGDDIRQLKNSSNT